MSVDWLASHISKLTGLGLEDVKSQVVPSVQAIDSRAKLETHLQELCGASSTSQSFIKTYTDARFPPPSLPKAKPQQGSITKTVQGRSGGLSLVRNAGAVASSSSGKGRKSGTGSGSNTPSGSGPSGGIHRDALAEAFGTGGGQVYIKNKETDGNAGILGWGGSGASGKGRSAGGGSVVASGRNTPDGGTATGMERSGSRSTSTPASEHLLSKSSHLHNPALAHENFTPTSEALEILKTPEVKKLEKLIGRVRDVQVGKQRWEEERDAEGMEEEGCFCQARVHALSSYTPSCARCGLILCILQPAHYPCPSCSATLLNAVTKQRLLAKLDRELDALLSRQRRAKELEEEERRKLLAASMGGGAFPTLGERSGSGAGNAMEAMRTGVPFVPPPVSRKVISIGSGNSSGGNNKSAPTKIVTYTKASVPLSSSSTAPTAPRAKPKESFSKIARPVSKGSTPDAALALSKAREANLAWRVAENRRWGDMDARKDGWEVRYIPVGKTLEDLEREDRGEGAEGENGTDKKKKRGKGKVEGTDHPVGKGWMLG